MRFLGRLPVLSLVLSQVSAIHVTEGSPCERLCGNVLDATTEEDVVCLEEEYASTAEGVVFQQCTSCQLTSDFGTRRDDNDLHWLLYNLRYAVSYCLYGYPENDDVTSSPCLTRTACEPLELAITYNDLASNGTTLDFCSSWIHDQMERCGACLRAGEDHYLTNFMTVLHAACEQRPGRGDLISIEGTPFSEIPVNVTEPTPIATDLPNYYPGPLSLDARVGIAFGGLTIILIIAGFFTICIGRRKRRSFLKELEKELKHGRSAWPTPIDTAGNNGGGGGSGSYFDQVPGGAGSQTRSPPRGAGWDDTPLSQKPLRDWDNSPQSAYAEKFSNQGFPRYFSPYSTQHNSPDTALDGRQVQWPMEKTGSARSPVQHVQEIGVALGGAEPHWAADAEGGDEAGEAYELREVEAQQQDQGQFVYGSGTNVPRLDEPSRPVYAQYNPADYYDVAEEDKRRGRAW